MCSTRHRQYSEEKTVECKMNKKRTRLHTSRVMEAKAYTRPYENIYKLMNKTKKQSENNARFVKLYIVITREYLCFVSKCGLWCSAEKAELKNL